MHTTWLDRAPEPDVIEVFRPKRVTQFAECIRKRHTEASSNLDAGGHVQRKSFINCHDSLDVRHAKNRPLVTHVY
jgi:hypothetical protein